MAPACEIFTFLTDDDFCASIHNGSTTGYGYDDENEEME